MANAKCRSCDHAADAGAYCSSCAAGIMANALNPFFGGRRKKLLWPEPPRPSQALRSLHSTSALPVIPCVQLCADSFQQTPDDKLAWPDP